MSDDPRPQLAPDETEKHLEDIEADLRFLRSHETVAGTEIWEALETVKEARFLARRESEANDSKA
jgi:hypothetical protein